MFEAKDIVEAVSQIDGGCSYCVEDFLDRVPENLRKELTVLLQEKDEMYFLRTTEFETL
jgi:hypothetical protein